MQIGDKISQLRLSKKLSQADLGNLCNLTRATILNYENDKQSPSVDKLEMIAKALGVPLFTFFIEDLSLYNTVDDNIVRAFTQSLVVDYKTNLTILPRIYLVRVKNIFNIDKVANQFSKAITSCDTFVLSKDLTDLGILITSMRNIEYDLVIFTDSATYITDELKNKCKELKGVLR